MTTNDKNRKESKSSLKAKYKDERIFLSSNCLLSCVLRPIQINLHRMYCAGVEYATKHFARNKITVDVGCVHYGHELGLTNPVGVFFFFF